jgi:hypothetical protein
MNDIVYILCAPYVLNVNFECSSLTYSLMSAKYCVFGPLDLH